MAVHQYSMEDMKQFTNNFHTVINSGGFTKVYQGTIDEKTVTVKMYEETHNNREIFKDEKDCLTQFRHPNIVKLKGYAEEHGFLILVLEYIPTPLDEALIKNLNWENTLKIMKEAASALAYIHGFGDRSYIYMDFKPDNVMIDEENRVKLIDLGSIMKEGKYPKSYSRAYAAPEVLGAVRNKPTQKADVYSFGTVMLQLMMKLDEDEVGETSSSGGRRGREVKKIIEAAEYEIKSKSYYVHKNLRGTGKQCSKDVGIEITKLALDCTKWGANVRPTMEEVVSRLNAF